MAKNNILLLSIKPKYADKIFNGTKTVELRRVCPKVDQGDLVFIYVSSPVKALAGAFRVEKVISNSPSILWNNISLLSGVSKEEFDEYFSGTSTGYAIFISDIWEFSKPIILQKIKEEHPEFRPPQNYYYLCDGEIFDSLLEKMDEEGIIA